MFVGQILWTLLFRYGKLATGEDSLLFNVDIVCGFKLEDIL